MSDLREPHATECSNNNQHDRWTSPCCYEDMDEAGGEGLYACPQCGRTVLCENVEIPSSRATIDPDDIESWKIRNGVEDEEEDAA